VTVDRVRYIRFMDLPLAWAEESGEPPQMVLRHLCEWTVAGAFPPGALVTAVGSEVDPLSIFEAFRALSNQGSVNIGGWSWHLDPGEALELLNTVLVTRDHVLSFCERTGTLPPPSLRGGVGWLLAILGQQKHLAPPPCPDGEDHAVRQNARRHAIGTMNSLRNMIAGLEGKPVRFARRRIAGEPIDLDCWNEDWRKMWEHARADVERSKEIDLRRELDALNSQWAALMAQEAGTAKGELKGDATDQTIPQEPAGDTSGLGKRRGRPPGSGSYEASDAPIVEKMREAKRSEPDLSTMAAAVRFVEFATGGGTPESKAKRLTERYSLKYTDGSR
jgi:hypothetical protein